MGSIVEFHARVLGFSVTQDQRGDQHAYVALRRGTVHIGAAQRLTSCGPCRTPGLSSGVELGLEVDDVRLSATGSWPLEEDLQHRAWA